MGKRRRAPQTGGAAPELIGLWAAACWGERMGKFRHKIIGNPVSDVAQIACGRLLHDFSAVDSQVMHLPKCKNCEAYERRDRPSSR